MARTRRHTRMRDKLTILTPDTRAQNEFGGISNGSYSVLAVVRCSATQYHSDNELREYNAEAQKRDYEFLIRKKSLPTLTGDEVYVLETPALAFKLNGIVEQDIRTWRLRCSALENDNANGLVASEDNNIESTLEFPI